MDSTKTFCVRTGEGSAARKIEGDTYSVETNGALIIRKEAGEVVAHFAPGHWGSIEIDSGEPEENSRPASKRAEKEAAGLSDHDRDVQGMQTLAQTGNPYSGKPVINEDQGENSDKPDGADLQNPPKTRINKAR